MLTLFFDPLTAYRILTVVLYIVCAIALVFGTICAVVLIQRSLAWVQSERLTLLMQAYDDRYVDYMEDHALGLDKPCFMKPTIDERLHLLRYKAVRSCFYWRYRMVERAFQFQARWQPMYSMTSVADAPSGGQQDHQTYNR